MYQLFQLVCRIFMILTMRVLVYLPCSDEFNIYYREAGAGTISVSIEGPSKADLTLVDRHAGYVTCSYVVSKEGLYVDEADVCVGFMKKQRQQLSVQ